MSLNAATRARFPWRHVMAFGLGVLRLSPDSFWRMTPREIHAASEALFGSARTHPDRIGLHELMQMFPDSQRQPDMQRQQDMERQ